MAGGIDTGCAISATQTREMLDRPQKEFAGFMASHLLLFGDRFVPEMDYATATAKHVDGMVQQVFSKEARKKSYFRGWVSFKRSSEDMIRERHEDIRSALCEKMQSLFFDRTAEGFRPKLNLDGIEFDSMEKFLTHLNESIPDPIERTRFLLFFNEQTQALFEEKFQGVFERDPETLTGYFLGALHTPPFTVSGDTKTREITNYTNYELTRVREDMEEKEGGVKFCAAITFNLLEKTTKIVCSNILH